MTSSARRLLALTLEERIDLLRRRTGAASSVLNAEDFFFARRPISQKTFRLYGVDKAVCRLPLADISAAELAVGWPNWNAFDSRYRQSNYDATFFAGAERSLCDCFWPIIGPALDALRMRIAAAAGAGLEIDAEQLIASALTTLHNRLFSICSRALVAELAAALAKGLLRGETPKARFDFFADCLRNPAFAHAILDQYPVLIRQASTAARDWSDALADFL